MANRKCFFRYRLYRSPAGTGYSCRQTAAAKFSAYVTGPQTVTILLIRTVTQVAQPFAQCVIGIAPQSIAVIGTIQQYFRIVIDSFFYFSQIPLLFSTDSITRSIKRLSPFF